MKNTVSTLLKQKQEGKKIVTENAYYLASLTGEHADEH